MKWIISCHKITENVVFLSICGHEIESTTDGENRSHYDSFCPIEVAIELFLSEPCWHGLDNINNHSIKFTLCVDGMTV